MRFELRKLLTSPQLCLLLILVLAANGALYWSVCTDDSQGYTLSEIRATYENPDAMAELRERLAAEPSDNAWLEEILGGLIQQWGRSLDDEMLDRIEQAENYQQYREGLVSESRMKLMLGLFGDSFSVRSLELGIQEYEALSGVTPVAAFSGGIEVLASAHHTDLLLLAFAGIAGLILLTYEKTAGLAKLTRPTRHGGKPTDYSAMFAALDELMAANLPQMELYRSIGHVVSGRPEKGAAVAAAGYLQGAYPDVTGLSPRSLRRMRDFYRAYENTPEVMAEAMTIGWTQNVVIMEADLSLQEKTWYIRAVRKFGWSKLELVKQIAASAHLEISLDLRPEVCYTEENSDPSCSSCQTQVNRVQRHLRRGDGAAAHLLRLRRIRPPDRDGPGQPAGYAPYLQRRCRRQDVPSEYRQEFAS